MRMFTDVIREYLELSIDSCEWEQPYSALDHKDIVSQADLAETFYCKGIEDGKAELEDDFKLVLDYLRQGKAKFTPNTTNSNVDAMLAKYKGRF